VTTTEPAVGAAPAAAGGTQQPFLHDLVSCVHAPWVAICAPDGEIRPGGAAGFYDGDTRVLSRLELRVDGHAPDHVGHQLTGPGSAQFVAVVPHLGDPIPDPTVTLTRTRTVGPHGLQERLEVQSAAQRSVTCLLTVRLGVDLLDMVGVKTGGTGAELPGRAVTGPDGVASRGLVWRRDHRTVEVVAEPAPTATRADDGTLEFSVALPPRGRATVILAVASSVSRDPAFRPVAVVDPPPWSRPSVSASDRRLMALLAQGLDDAQSLLVADPAHPGDRFLAAGSPWFLTLFGRDSLWAARMLLPLGTELARGTLAALARRQGQRSDAQSEEAPGKILHEVREAPLQIPGVLTLPALYYGTVDATPLWVCVLADAWRWGLPEAEVETLLPACEAALGWLVEHGDSDGDGFLEYVDHTGRGLANQGWKDSHDSIQWSDGRLATAPLALCEVQGYAYEAAVAGADLLEAFGRAGTDRWRAWAARLQQAFRDRFWVEDERGPFPAVALDQGKTRVDSLTSNIGHLLGTGLLDAEESQLVAARLAGPDMDSGYGLRTLSASSPRFGPLSYHGGTVWPHDTAIVVGGLVRSGQPALAGSLVEGLLAAAAHFDYRLPELFGGIQRGNGPLLAYPAACRPQAWAATSAVALLQALLGLTADVPAGRVSVTPMAAEVVGDLAVRGLRVADGELSVTVDRVTGLSVQAPVGLAVDGPAAR